jgi:hypothetical protein
MRLGLFAAAALVLLAVVSQLALPPYLEHRVAGRLAEHGGSANVELGAVPAARLLFGGGDSIRIRADGLSVDLQQGQSDVFKRLDGFRRVDVEVTGSRAGPFSIKSFTLRRVASHRYAISVAANATAGDVARYAGSQLGGSFGQALAGLAAGAIGGFDRPVPVDAAMEIETTTQPPQAVDVRGAVAGLPAGPLAAIVTNALLSGL